MTRAVTGFLLIFVLYAAHAAEDLHESGFYIYGQSVWTEVDHTHREVYPNMDTTSDGIGVGGGYKFNSYIGIETYFGTFGNYRLSSDNEIYAAENLEANLLSLLFEAPVGKSNFGIFSKLSYGVILSTVKEGDESYPFKRTNNNSVNGYEFGFTWKFPIFNRFKFYLNHGAIKYETTRDNIGVFNTAGNGRNRLTYTGTGARFTF